MVPMLLGYNPGDDAGPRYGTHRTNRVSIRVADTFGSKLVEVRRFRIAVTIATHHRCDVFDRNVHNVGSVLRRLRI